MVFNFVAIIENGLESKPTHLGCQNEYSPVKYLILEIHSIDIKYVIALCFTGSLLHKYQLHVLIVRVEDFREQQIITTSKTINKT